MVGDRGTWRTAVGVGWILVVACSGGGESSVSSAPGPQGHRASMTVLDQRASDAPPLAALPPLAASPGGEVPSPELSASPAPAAPVPALERQTPNAASGGAAGEDNAAPSGAAPAATGPADAGLPLANDASVPVVLPEPPAIEPPVIEPPAIEPPAIEPPVIEPPAIQPPPDAGAPPEVVPEPAIDAGAPPEAVPPVEPPAPAPTSFETEVWPIFKANCSGCHGTRRAGGHSVASPVLATAYADAQRLGSTLIERLNGGAMPPSCDGLAGDPGCISIAELATIQRWLDTGMAP